MNDIKFATPDIGTYEIEEMEKIVNSRWITNGPTVREFERRIAKVSNCDHAVAFDSCTAAMEMSLNVLGIGLGDEVITTPYTYTATAEVIARVGAKIVFVDLDGESFEMDYKKLRDAITVRTKAIIPVDIGGKLCDYNAIFKAINDKRDMFFPKNPLQKSIGRIAVISDSAHSFQAERHGKICGEFADFTCFSFHVLKNLTTGGEGGAVVWRNFNRVDNDDLETIFRLLGDHGQTSRNKSKGWEYDISLIGYNSIMTDIDAAMGIAQLHRFGYLHSKRRAVTEKYDSLFSQTSDIVPLIRHLGPDYTSAMHLYPVRVPGGEEDRNRIFNQLREVGVPCNVHYKPLPMMTAYKQMGYDIKDYPNAYNMFKNLLTIPYHTELTEEQQEYVYEQMIKAVRK